MALKIKNVAIPLLLLGVTALSSCSTWRPGEGYKIFKNEINDRIENSITSLGGTDFGNLKIEFCNYLWITGRTKNYDPTYYAYTFKTVFYKIKYSYSYIPFMETNPVTETKYGYSEYLYTLNDMVYYTTENGETEYEKRHGWISDGKVFGAIGIYDIRDL